MLHSFTSEGNEEAAALMGQKVFCQQNQKVMKAGGITQPSMQVAFRNTGRAAAPALITQMIHMQVERKQSAHVHKLKNHQRAKTLISLRVVQGDAANWKVCH